ncbi:GvpL/GvpF family gas vesicle protein [Streptomyces sp. MS2A]|uniref:GvpL/GvpF family gas vesicle protein n=1 Tax=Streptomyces coelicoflavus TaxID=285562 RepID=UPI0022F09175|nr:GvpL/GvpF family gas vesicle protein [Streptomyces sp. MS2A]
MSTTAAGPEAPGIVCAFAVSRTPPDPALLAAARGHEEGGPLRAVRAGGLYLVVQDVPAALFGEEALTERLNRPGDLERCARAHHRGVEAAAGRGPVVPLPMATLYRGDLTAVRAVTARQPVLETLLDRLCDRREWAVKVHAAEAPPESATDPGARTAPGGGGRAYLSRVSARRRDRRGAHEKALAEAEAVDAELRRYAVAATRHRPQSERLTGRRAPQLLNIAYLVDDARRADFTEALARIAADGGRRAVRVDASGPWIPYSFARWDEDPQAGPEQEVRP